MNAEPVSPSHLGNWLLSRGCHFVTTAEVAELVGVSQRSVEALMSSVKLDDPRFTEDLNALIPQWPEKYDNEAAAESARSVIAHISN